MIALKDVYPNGIDTDTESSAFDAVKIFYKENKVKGKLSAYDIWSRNKKALVADARLEQLELMEQLKEGTVIPVVLVAEKRTYPAGLAGAPLLLLLSLPQLQPSTLEAMSVSTARSQNLPARFFADLVPDPVGEYI